MTYSIKKLPKSQIEISVAVPADEFEAFRNGALLELAEKIQIEGFRAGKAPLSLVKEKIGAAELMQLATEKAIQKHFIDIVEKEKLDLIGHPDAHIETAEHDLEFSVTAALFPEITLPDYKAIAQDAIKEKKEQTVEEKEVDESIKWLRESRVKHVTVAREARTGDRVEIDFTVKNNGIVIEGGVSKNHPLILGEGKFIPGFEDQITGMKEREEKDFKLTMPKDYPNNLGGKELYFHVILHLVQERELPEITDEFAKGLGTFQSTDELHKSIHEGLLREKNEKERQRIDMIIAETIAKKAAIDVPDALIESELEKMLREFEGNIAKMGMEFEKYLEHLKKTKDDFKKEWRGDAEKRVKIALCLKKIADAEHIKPTEDEVSAKANNSLAIFKADGHDIEKIDKRSLAEYSRTVLRNEKVFEFLETLA